jgi:hypothetical protein
VDPFPAGDGQDDAGVLHLEPTQAAAAGDAFQDRQMRRRDGQRRRSSATHEGASETGFPSA